MGVFDFIKKQFIDVIEWNESSDGVLAYRYAMKDQEIQNGAQLTVRETQTALFVNEGEIADIFEPGLHTLSTKNLPILTNLKNWDKFFSSPFKSDLYFFSTREQIDQRWGTQSPLTVRDPELGPVRLRAHGAFSYKVKNPAVFFKKISGTREQYTTEELAGQLRSVILTELSTFLGGGKTSFLDMAANQSHFSKSLQEVLTPAFENLGLALQSFFVQSISLPEELQATLDKVGSMRMLGDLQKYAQFQAADSISIAAKNEGGVAGAGAGLGAGIAMGQAMMHGLSGASSESGNVQAENPMDALERLHKMMTQGILSAEEFAAKKAELLQKIK